MLCTVRIVYRSPPNRYTQSSYVRPVYCAVLRGGVMVLRRRRPDRRRVPTRRLSC